MFVKNCWDLKLPFIVANIVIPFDNRWHEIPDGSCEPNGVKGYLRCARTNPEPPPVRPTIIEIDLTPIYKKMLSPEDQIKAEKVLQESMRETIELTNKKKLLEDINGKKESQTENISTPITTENTEPINNIRQENTQENKKIIQPEKKIKPLAGKRIKRGIMSRIDKDNPKPLKGFKIKNAIRNKMDQDKIKTIIDDGKRDYALETQNKIDQKLGLL